MRYHCLVLIIFFIFNIFLIILFIFKQFGQNITNHRIDWIFEELQVSVFTVFFFNEIFCLVEFTHFETALCALTCFFFEDRGINFYRDFFRFNNLFSQEFCSPKKN